MIKIVSDSSTLYSCKEAEKIGLYTVPLNVSIDNHSYKDLEEITDTDLFKMIEEHKIPRTSQPSLGEKIDIYNKLSEENEVIDITMASGLSGTYQTALIAKASCDHSDKVHVIDSMTLCGPHRYLVDTALEMVKNGSSVQDILHMIEESRKTDISFLLPVDFDYLVRGGRIKGVAAKIGGLLKIIPVLKKGDDGVGLEKHSINRTLKKAIDSVIDDLKANHIDDTYHFYITHAKNEDLANRFIQKIQETFNTKNIFTYPLSPSFITQGGPGCVAIQVIKIVY